MRVIKGIVLFCFSILAVSGCFDPPEFSNVPHITFNKIRFKDQPGAADYDSLIISLDFRDGDGDVGLSPTVVSDFEYPYNSEFYYLYDGMGDTTTIISYYWNNYTLLSNCPPEYSDDPASPNYCALAAAKITTSKTRLLPNYAWLPPYLTSSCLNYSFQTQVLVPLQLVVAENDIQDTVLVDGRPYAELEEAFYYRPNPNHYNIEITFEQATQNGWEEFDWYEEYCTTYDGRFSTSTAEVPVYTNRPIEGTIRYSMANTNFLGVFGSNKLRIKARIRDRALNVSNETVSYEFDLLQIRD